MDEKSAPEQAAESEQQSSRRTRRTEYRRRYDEPHHSGSPVLALIFIVLGVIFLLNNLGLTQPEVWSGLWQYWPVILILLGVQAILGRSRVSSFIVFLLGLVILGGILLLPFSGSSRITTWIPQDRDRQEQTVTIQSSEYPAVTSRTVRLRNGLGRVDVTDSTDPYLLKWEALFYGNGSEPQVDQKTEGETLVIDVDTNQAKGWFWGRDDMKYALELGDPGLPTDLSLDTGVGKTDVALTEVPLRTLSVNIGTGSSDVELGASSIPTKQSTLEVGTGSISLQIPRDTGLRLDYNVGLGQIKVDSTTIRGDGTYTSPGYDAAAKKMELDVRVGTGSVTITTD